MEWDKGTTASAIGHAGLILWIALGDWLFAPSDAPELQVAEVSLISAADFDALVASAPKSDTPAPEPAPAPQPAPEPPQVTAPEPVQPDLPPPAPQPEPAPPRLPIRPCRSRPIRSRSRRRRPWPRLPKRRSRCRCPT